MKTVRRILLAVVLVGAVAAGVLFMGRYSALEDGYAATLSKAESELAENRKALEAVDRRSPEGAAAWESWKEEALAEGETRLEQIKDESSDLSKAISDKEAELEKVLQDEDTAYYMEIYDSMKEGMSKVEGYIEQGN